jgi:lambda family phage portal protein
MNPFSRALTSISRVFDPPADTSLYRNYGFNRNADIQKFFNEPMERSFGFEGAWYDRTNSNWVAWRSSLDAILRTSIWILIGRCRDLQRSNQIVGRALNLWKNNVVGAHGIRLRMNLRNADGTPQTELNQQISTAWKRFSRRCNLTPAGNMDMVEFQKHIMGTVPIDGTCFIKIFKGRQYPFGIAFRILEVDLLDSNKFAGHPDEDTEIKFGIESSRKTGKVLAYWMFLSNPNDLSLGSNYTAGKSFRVPAEEIIMVMKRERPMQSIGCPWFVRAMVNLHILQSYTKATLIKAQMVASYFLFITNTLAVQDGDAGADGDPNGFQEMPVENGIALELKKGQDVKNQAPVGVAGDMEALFKWVLRQFSGDLDLSYYALSGDTSQANYSSLRMEALEERAGHISNQVWLASTVLEPMFDAWIEIQLLTQRKMKVPDELADDLCYFAEWIGRRWDWVDPKNESAAEIALVNAALKSRTQYWRDRGFETDEMIQELTYEQVRLEDEEIIIQTSSGQQMHFGQTDATAEADPAKGTGKEGGSGGDEEGE